MEELLTAIVARWNAAAGATIRAKAPGGLHWIEAPQSVLDDGTEYVTYRQAAGSVANTMSTTMEEPVIQFSVFSKSEDGALTVVQIRDLLIALYDDQALTMTGGNEMTRMIRQTSTDAIKDPDEGYEAHVDYLVMYEY